MMTALADLQISNNGLSGNSHMVLVFETPSCHRFLALRIFSFLDVPPIQVNSHNGVESQNLRCVLGACNHDGSAPMLFGVATGGAVPPYTKEFQFDTRSLASSFPCLLSNLQVVTLRSGFRSGMFCALSSGAQLSEQQLTTITSQLCDLVPALSIDHIGSRVNWADYCLQGGTVNESWTGVLFLGHFIGLHLVNVGLHGKLSFAMLC